MLISQNIKFENIILLTNFQGTVKCIKVLFLHIKITEIQICPFPVMQHKQVYIYLPVDHLWNQQDTTDQVFYGPVYYLGVNQHADYAQHGVFPEHQHS